jgi:hypothetical protein
MAPEEDNQESGWLRTHASDDGSGGWALRS